MHKAITLNKRFLLSSPIFSCPLNCPTAFYLPLDSDMKDIVRNILRVQIMCTINKQMKRHNKIHIVVSMTKPMHSSIRKCYTSTALFKIHNKVLDAIQSINGSKII